MVRSVSGTGYIIDNVLGILAVIREHALITVSDSACCVSLISEIYIYTVRSLSRSASRSGDTLVYLLFCVLSTDY